MDRKKKDHILAVYKRLGFNTSRRIEKLIDDDIAELERIEKWKKDDA